MSSLLNHCVCDCFSLCSLRCYDIVWRKMNEIQNETRIFHNSRVDSWLIHLNGGEEALQSYGWNSESISLSSFLSSQYEPLLWPVAKVLLGSNLLVEFLLRFHLESNTCMFPLWYGCITIPAVSTQFFRVRPTNVLRDGETLCLHGMCDTKVRPQPGKGRSWESAGSKTLSATELRCHRQQPALISPATLQRAAPH